MKVKFNKRKPVIDCFSNLSPGTIFKYKDSDILYMKVISDDSGDGYKVDLGSGVFHLIALNQEVEVLEAELTIFQ